jgi:hypothetical protein
METFIRMVRPSVLRKMVVPFAMFRKTKLRIKIDHRLKFGKYLDWLEGAVEHSESGYAQLVREHTEVHTLSADFLRWFDPRVQVRLRSILKVGEQDHRLRKRAVSLGEDEDSSTSRSKKPSLKSIADSLNASHKNMRIEDSLWVGSQSNFERCYSQIF